MLDPAKDEAVHQGSPDAAITSLARDDDKHNKVFFENERLRVLEVTLEPNNEEPGRVFNASGKTAMAPESR
jgi:hypothetical protein